MTKQKRFARLSSVGAFAVLAFVIGCTGFALISGRDWPLTRATGPLHSHRPRPFRPSQANALRQNLSAPVVRVIDPVLVYTTFIGGPDSGSAGQQATAMLVDAAGNIYVAGNTDSHTFPTTAGVVSSYDAGGTSFPRLTRPARLLFFLLTCRVFTSWLDSPSTRRETSMPPGQLRAYLFPPARLRFKERKGASASLS